MWFLYCLDPANASYHIGMALHCTGMLDAELLHWALSAVVRRHDVLRTVFGEHEGIPYQRVDNSLDLDFEIIDATPEKLPDLCLAAAIKRFCLESAPGVRAILLRLSDHDHVLQITLHHIISDAWSINILLGETAQLYEAFLSGSMRSLPPLQVQYWQFAAEERAALLKSEMESDLAYWRKQLEGMAPTQLPADRTPPSGQTNLGAKLSVALHSELFGKIQELCRREGLTLFMVLVAGLQVVLGRWMAQEDITVGTAVANRKSAELEALIGLFVNTLVIRTRLSGNPTVRELCKRVRHVCLGAYAHQDLPFDTLVIELNPERNLKRNPLFETIFTLENAPSPHVHLPGLRLEPMVLDWGASAFDMALSVWEAKGRLEGWLEYSTELFETQTMQRFLDHWQRALEEMTAAPGKEISSVHLLSPKERQQILEKWNATAQANQLDHCVHELFEQNAQLMPEALAVVHGKDELTYHELNERSNQLAHYLIRLNPGPEKLIGIFLPRSTEIIVAMLATLKAGAAYIPLDPDYPSERIRFILDNARASMVLTHAVLAERLGWQEELTLSLDHHQQAITKESPVNPHNKLSALNLAYVIYTSGSTGQPKGVQISHASLLNLVQWHLQAFDVTSTDIASQMASLGFDAAVWEIWPCLVAGAKLCLIDDHVRLSPADLRDLILARNITISFMPTPVAEGVLALDWPQKTSLKTLLAGGDKLHRCGSRQFPFAVVNNYGPTECTVVATSMTVDHSKEMDPPIGHPIRNAKTYVLDREMELVPARVAGELYIGGTGLARSYVNHSEMTAEKFVPDPLSQEPGARLYRTGDLVRWRLDGTLEFLGRADEQVKIRGFRIEPGEIEAALGEHPQVRQATVVVQDKQGTGRRLVAYFVPENAEKINTGQLRTYLKDRLPDYMVPSLFMEIAELPLTSNGKVDRKALPIPETDQNATNYIAPRTVTEEILCSIWSQVLNVPRLGVEDNFFALGGHSLLATQLVSRVRKVFLLEVPLRTVFEAPTITEMAEWIERERLNATQNLIPPITRADRTQPLPLSFAQQRLWFIDQLEPSSATYNIPLALRILGPLNQDALRWAVQEIVRRQESLRTRFPQRDGIPVQEIEPEAELRIELIDLTEVDEGKREQEAVKKAAEEGGKPFDLERGPLVRTQLLRLAEQEHVLLVIMHHIISDGWSMEIMLKEFSHLYEARCKGKKSPLTELPIQYADFSIWQRDWLRGAVLEKQLDYWKQRLEGLQPLELPTDRRRPALIRQEGASVNFKVERERLQDLKRLSREQGTTLYMTCLAAWQALLYRYTGQEDIAVGSPIAGRRWVETEGLIGFFVNTLVLRTGVGGKQSFAELLQQVREITLTAHAHQDLPFEKLVEELAPERNSGRTPLFQVMFALHSRPNLELELDEIKLTPFRVESPTAKFDLLLTLIEDKEDLEGMLSYRRDLFEADTTQRIIRHYSMLLASSVARPEDAICQLPMLLEGERHQLLVDWNQTAFEWPKATVVDLFERQVNKAPEALAVEYEGKCLTYRELNGRANQLGRHLRRLGVGPDVRVGLYAERSIELVVGILGVLKAGGAYVPLDPNYPAERLAFMLNESGAAVLLRQVKLPSASPEFNGKVVVMDDDWRESTLESADNLVHQISCDNLAYVVYTSGSTGRPKGIGISHQSLTNHMRWMQEEFRYQPQDRILQKTSTSFDASVWEFYAPLLSGGQLVLLKADGHQNPESLARQITEAGITVVQMVPSVLEAVLQASPARNPETTRPDHLRFVMCGGEVLKLAPVKVVRKHWGAEVVNLYGPTECTIDATFWRAGLDWNEERIPIGKPIANTTVYALDSEMQPVPVGVAGELYIGGAVLARGYVNRPALTAERFVPNPFVFTSSSAQENSGLQGGQRLYRTGDRVRWREDGNLDYLERLDEQIKVRGLRIELGEIEAALREQPGVAQAVVVVYEETEGDKRLVAYVVRDPRAERFELSKEGLRHGLRKSLPEYMVPGTIVELETLPQTSSGKIDRRALSRISPADYRDEKTYVAPRTVPEEVLANIWAELLQTDRIGIHDNFFELGGHSLLATQLVSRLRERLGAEVAIKTVFESPTLGALAKCIQPGQQRRPRCERQVRPAQLPLSYAQRRLWFIDRLGGTSTEYNMSGALRLTGSLDQEALVLAINTIVERHESLRTHFADVEGEAVQLIEPVVRIAVPIVDFSELKEHEREPAVSTAMRNEAHQPFDLTQGPVLRTKLLKIREEEHILLWTMHHIVSDGWSMGVFSRELATLYDAYAEGRENPLNPLEAQYADFALWQRAWLGDEDIERGLRYWKHELAGISEELELPKDRGRAARQTFGADLHETNISPEQVMKLKRLGEKNHATFYMTLLAAFGVLLGRYSGQDDIVIGSPIANRQDAQLEELIGFFVNSLAMRVRVNWEQNFEELLRDVRRRCLEAYRFQDVPFERVVEELSPRRNLNVTPVYQVVLAVQNAPAVAPRLAGLKVDWVSNDELQVRFDLEVHVWERTEGVTISWVYNRDLFNRWRIEQMARHYVTLLCGVIENATQRVGCLQLLTKEDRQQVLYDWNAPKSNFGKECIHQLFEQQAQLTPSHVAVECEAEKLTYTELNRRANQLAHYLRSFGVGPEVIAGVCMKRSSELSVGLLGILKAGGAYLPLDPSYPRQRLEYMLLDSGAKVLLTSAAFGAGLKCGSARVVDVEAERQEIGKQSQQNLAVTVEAKNLAYVIYTSGSTGWPKEVQICHGNLSQYLEYCRGTYHGKRKLNALVHSSPSFDLTVTGMFSPWTVGERVTWVREQRGVEGLLEGLNQAKRAVLVKLTPSHLQALQGRLDGEVAGRVKVLIVGGEALTDETVQWWREHSPHTRVVNEYGPTEATVGCCVYWDEINNESENRTFVPIGRAIENAEMYVLDKEMELSPVGVTGELYIGGAGLARGYAGQASLTAEKFVPNPFNASSGERLYRTGDLVRWKKDGNLEFFGRKDHQVKIRGYRIELGEIEAALLDQESVNDAVVVPWENAFGETRLVAYVVADSNVKNPENNRVYEVLGAEQISQWTVMFDEINLASGRAEDPAFNLAGWKSSYTGQPIASEEMSEWIGRTVERIEALKPKRAWEVGCGTGLMLFRIAPRCEYFLGTDISRSVLDQLQQHISTVESKLPHVTLERRAAHEFTGTDEGRDFDLVLLNSVVQYFPGIEYLARVIAGAVKVLGPGGTIFVGDVRGYPSLESFHTSLELHHAADSLSCDALWKRVQKKCSREKELVIHPGFFVDLPDRIPQIKRVKINLKRGRARNELTCFRYDVVLQVGDPMPQQECVWLNWQEENLSPERLREVLGKDKPDLLGVTGMPDARVEQEVNAVRMLTSKHCPATVGELRRRLEDEQRCGIELEDIWSLEDDLPYTIEIRGSQHETGRCDLLFRKAHDRNCLEIEGPVAFPGDKHGLEERATYANDPLRPNLFERLVPQLRRHLNERLPEYMVPSAYVMMDSLPLTVNGKLDRKALPSPDRTEAPREVGYVGPRTPMEEWLTQIWGQVLGIDRVGVTDDFFALGGHSISALRLVALTEAKLARKLPLAVLFRTPTIEQLAVFLTNESDGRGFASLVPIRVSGSLKPLFLVHPVGGSVYAYKGLAALINNERPVYAFQSQVFNGLPPHSHISEMAAAYLKEMIAIQPHGPYLLGGWSLGGVIAFEMALQLKSQSLPVALLALFDSYPSFLNKGFDNDSQQLFLNFATDLGLSIQELATLADCKSDLTEDQKLEFIIQFAKDKDILPKELKEVEAIRIFNVFKLNTIALQHYNPQSHFDGTILLLKAADGPHGSHDLREAWRRFGASLESYSIPGDHYGIIKGAGIQFLAERLNICLDRVTEDLTHEKICLASSV